MAASARFPALRHPEYRRFWMSSNVSLLGTEMQAAALRWHIYILTGDPLALGMVGLFRAMPVFVFSLIGGVVADAVDRRKVVLVTQAMMLSTALALCLLTVSGHISAPFIYLLTAINGGVAAFNNPARQSLIPNMVPREDFPNAVSLGMLGFRIGSVCGPLLAGVLIHKDTLFWVYAINAATFIPVIYSLFVMKVSYAEPRAERKTKLSKEDFVEGFRFVRSMPILWWTMVLDFTATFFASADSLLPIFAKDILRVDAWGYGVLAASEAIGALGAGAVMALLPPVQRPGRWILWSVSGFAVATILFGLSRSFTLSVIALALLGASDTVSTVLRGTLRQLFTPDHLRGRMVSVNMLFVMTGPPMGNLEAGVAAKLIGVQASVIAGGLGCLLAAGFIAWRVPALRRYVEGGEEAVAAST